MKPNEIETQSKESVSELKEKKAGARELWLVEASGDGQRDSKLVSGTMEDVKKCLADMMWFGPYEEAMQDPMVSAYVNSLDDPDNWAGEVWNEDGEQCWFRVSSVTDATAHQKALDEIERIRVMLSLEMKISDLAVDNGEKLEAENTRLKALLGECDTTLRSAHANLAGSILTKAIRKLLGKIQKELGGES